MQKVIYEQPLSERMRAFLRLEFLFQTGVHHARGRSVWDSRAAMSCLLDILSIFSRSDLKSEVLKELERHTANLTAMQSNPQVDRDKLAGIMRQLDTLSARLHAHRGQIAQALRQNEFLMSIQQRSSIAGGSCAFDLPAYFHWLQRPAPERVEQLLEWFSVFDLIRTGVELILELTRQSSTPVREIAKGGFFQQNLPTNLPCQMMRVAVPRCSPYFAEISGSKHRFTVRFLEASVNGRASQTSEDVEFELTRCVL
ncbi:MAG: cell division protein ZapD [Proteobacteria bacterium]|nr:MAG: cell division protein ZapD [Pseudomonadota bacterium]